MAMTFETYRGAAFAYLNRASERMKAQPEIKASVIEASAGNTLQIEIYEEIDGLWGIGPKQIGKALKDAGAVKAIEIRLNSPGGNVFDGVAIYNLLKAQTAPVNIYIDGVAASAASVIAMAGDTLTMGSGAWLMIHQAWGMAVGTAEDMQDTAELLERINGELSTIYQKRSGKDATTVDNWIDNETWFTGEEAVAAGLADTVSGEAASLAAATELEKYGYAKIPEALNAAAYETAEETTMTATTDIGEEIEHDIIAKARQRARHEHARALIGLNRAN